MHKKTNMKKTIYLTMAIACNASIFAQMGNTETATANPIVVSNNNSITGTDTITAPIIVGSNFDKDYPNEVAIWHMDGVNYKAWYIDSQTKLRRSVIYDKNGNLVRIDNELEYNEVPVGIINYYSANTNKDNYHVWESLTEKGDKVFISKMDGKTDYFDKDAKHLTVRPVLKKDDRIKGNH